MPLVPVWQIAELTFEKKLVALAAIALADGLTATRANGRVDRAEQCIALGRR
jgi:hypothetical protein